MGNQLSKVKKFKLSSKQLEKLASQTHFSEDEITFLFERFKSISNAMVKDNLIDVNEFKDTLGIRSLGFAKRVFAAFDSDQSDGIDFPEFIIGLSSISERATIEEKARFCFDVYDIDKNGTISTEELHEVFTYSLSENPSIHLTKEQIDCLVEQAFNEIDTNGDKEISFEEFLAAAEKNNAILDCVCFNYDEFSKR